MTTAVKMGSIAGPNYSLNVSSTSKVILEFEDGLFDPSNFPRTGVSKIHVITPFTFEAEVNLRGANIPYHCSITAKIEPDMELSKYPNTLSVGLRDHVMAEFQKNVTKLVLNQGDNFPLKLNIDYNERTFACSFNFNKHSAALSKQSV